MEHKGHMLSEKKKPTHLRRFRTVWFHLYNSLEMTTLVVEKRLMVARGSGWSWEGVGLGVTTEGSTSEISVVMELFCILTVLFDE